MCCISAVRLKSVQGDFHHNHKSIWKWWMMWKRLTGLNRTNILCILLHVDAISQNKLLKPKLSRETFCDSTDSFAPLNNPQTWCLSFWSSAPLPVCRGSRPPLLCQVSSWAGSGRRHGGTPPPSAGVCSRPGRPSAGGDARSPPPPPGTRPRLGVRQCFCNYVSGPKINQNWWWCNELQCSSPIKYEVFTANTSMYFIITCILDLFSFWNVKCTEED